jgi:hypothetical protein
MHLNWNDLLSAIPFPLNLFFFCFNKYIQHIDAENNKIKYIKILLFDSNQINNALIFLKSEKDV